MVGFFFFFLEQHQCSEQVATGQVHGCKRLHSMCTLCIIEPDLLIKHFLWKVKGILMPLTMALLNSDVCSKVDDIKILNWHR